MGVFIVGFFVTTQTLIQLNAAAQYRGRVASALGTTTSLMALFGILLSSALGDRVGAVGLLDGTGSLNALAGVVAMALLRNVKIHKRPPEAQHEPLPPPATA
jgi:MFS family permease